jgi:hypothetical protein
MSRHNIHSLGIIILGTFILMGCKVEEKAGASSTNKAATDGTTVTTTPEDPGKLQQLADQIKQLQDQVAKSKTDATTTTTSSKILSPQVTDEFLQTLSSKNDIRGFATFYFESIQPYVTTDLFAINDNIDSKSSFYENLKSDEWTSSFLADLVHVFQATLLACGDGDNIDFGIDWLRTAIPFEKKLELSKKISELLFKKYPAETLKKMDEEDESSGATLTDIVSVTFNARNRISICEKGDEEKNGFAEIYATQLDEKLALDRITPEVYRTEAGYQADDEIKIESGYAKGMADSFDALFNPKKQPILPTKKILIKGYFDSSETADKGLARAKMVHDALLKEKPEIKEFVILADTAELSKGETVDDKLNRYVRIFLE